LMEPSSPTNTNFTLPLLKLFTTFARPDLNSLSSPSPANNFLHAGELFEVISLV